MNAPTILVVMDAVDTASACLRAAADAAAALEQPRIEALHIDMDAAGSLDMPEVLTDRYEKSIDRRSAAEGKALRAAFDAWQVSARIAGAIWLDVNGIPAVAIRERGELAALLVLGRPTAGTHPADAAGFDAAVFDTGRPVLVVPTGGGAPFGQHLAVGWRDVTATRNSLEALRPWLMAARTVSVIAVSDEPAIMPAEWQAANLPPSATLHTVATAGRSDGEALLQAATALGADGLAIGAYRHGRLVERLVGGVTADVLRTATIPVLMHM